MRIQDVMSRDVVSIDPKLEVSAARERLRLAEIHHLVVVDGKKVIGVVSEKDLVRAGDQKPVTEAMSRGVVTIEPSATLRKAAGVMRGRAVGCLPVLDKGRLVGIVTTSDLLTALSKGEIHAGPPADRVTMRRGVQRKRPRH